MILLLVLKVDLSQAEEILNTKANNIWTKNMEKLGGKFQIMSKFPQNPSDN